MSSAYHPDSHERDSRVPRVASRAGSISTLWSSAEVPFCLDPRVHNAADPTDNHHYATRNPSVSYSSARSSQLSIDFARLSIDIPDEYPRRPDSIRLSPPRQSASSSSASSGSSPSRVPSFNIGTIDEDAPMQSSPISKLPYHPPSLAAQSRLLSSRFSEDTIDERPFIHHSSSHGTFGPPLNELRKASGVSDDSIGASSRSSSYHDPTQPMSTARGNEAPSKHLYRRAYRFFDETYTVQPPSDADDHQVESTMGACSTSQTSHDDSLPSCSRSQTSSHATTSDSASASSVTSATPHMLELNSATLTPTSVHGDSTLLAQGCAAASDGGHLSIPSQLSFNSALTATRAGFNQLRVRPSTADVYTHEPPVSPLTFPGHVLPVYPPQQHVQSPTDARYEVRSEGLTSYEIMHPTLPEPQPKINAARSPGKARFLRARVASSPKLRLDASSLFAAAHTPVPPLPGAVNNAAAAGDAERRPSTAQTDGRAPFFGRRFRSRTLGESDRVEAHTNAAATKHEEPPRAVGWSTATGGKRHPSQVSATSSELFSHSALQPTPGSSICSASSPATTNSSLPVTPRTTTTFPRPKSRGTGSASKAGGSGWASYLHAGLTLHLEHDGRVVPVTMTYLAYDPFGRPEQLVEGTEAARAMTPKRPKSRGDKDQEAEQSGTLEFGPLDDRALDVGRKCDGSAVLKHLTVGEDTKADLLTRQAALSTRTGVHQVAGYERRGRLAWKFAYRVEGEWERRLVPVRFSCSATLLNPERARKSRLINLVKKQMVPSLASKVVPSIDSPRSASLHSEASPASSRRAVLPDGAPVSPVRLAGAMQNSPLRQPSRAGASFASATSADTSYSSQPATPGRDTDPARLHLQASPVSAQFGQPQRPIPSVASVAPALQLDLGDAHAGRVLHTKPSSTSLSSASSAAKPIVVNGRKLIPISLPAGLARQTKIDPALLQGHIVPRPDRSPSQSQPRSGSRPPTASESIKLEYLARAEGLRQRSFGVLVPAEFADSRVRRRSRTVEADERRPFTADAWGEAQYPIENVQLGKHNEDRTPREGVFGRQQGGAEGYMPLSAPPRPQRPRTAQATQQEKGRNAYGVQSARQVQGVRS
ncbi:uncharacterized protein PAN0_018d5714 [Moesziomyces antarcticus]|uniref:Uncharacterized protein n=2 Tax=Pseudozyma antarctica TaxID=84753 RepID=A0A081CLE0_PSEA2|nr:uncharacterized protein PAN0_018d5714 [Moesziomyces antarcticus]GAK67486.1 conserved hypothetical protein [Moesziomyces antarcticus]SPO48747.1 uncharacterized protein PSANT_06438 [Moesziomyces antarcticus]